MDLYFSELVAGVAALPPSHPPSRDADQVDLGVGEVVLELNPEMRGLLGVAASRARVGYDSPMGQSALREVYSQQAVPTQLVSRTDCLITSGAREACWLGLLALSRVGDTVAVPSPGWPMYGLWLGALKRNVVSYCPRSLLAAPEDTIAELRCEALVLNYPHNPTGIVASQTGLDRVVQAAAAAGVSVVSDEVYRRLSPSPHASVLRSSAFETDSMVVADSLSKSHAMAGIRVGFLVGAPSVVRDLAGFRSTYAACSGTLGQTVGEALLSSQIGGRWVEYVRDTVASNLARLEDVLGRPEIGPGSSGHIMYLWSPGDRGGLGADHHGVVGVAGKVFGTPSWVRLCAARSEATILEAVSRLDGPGRGC